MTLLITALFTHLRTYTLVSPDMDMRFLLHTLGQRALANRDKVVVVTPIPIRNATRNEIRVKTFLKMYMSTPHANQVMWWTKNDRTGQWFLDSVELPVVWWHAGGSTETLEATLRDTTYVVVFGCDGVPDETLKTVLTWHRAVNRDVSEYEPESGKQPYDVKDVVDKTDARLFMFRGASFL